MEEQKARGGMERGIQGADYGSVLGWGNRGWMEIIDLILFICEPGALKTHVMYRCNLNSKQVKQYLDFALSRELARASPDPEGNKRTVYMTTDKGREFIRACDELQEIFIARA